MWRVFTAAFAGVLLAVSMSAAMPHLRAYAYDPFQACGSDCTNQLKDNGLAQNTGSSKAKNLINTALMALGAIAIIMVVVGGLRITFSRGEAAQVKAGRETILYAVAGLVVAISAYAIINFVISFNW